MEIPRWNLGAIPKLLQHVEDQEAINTFNMGWGWVAIVPPAQAEQAVSVLSGARILGEVTDTGEVTVSIK